MKKTYIPCGLKTPFETDATGWEREHPTPQMRRDLWMSLCGTWDFSVRTGAEERRIGEIRVPFPPESRLSGIGQRFSPDTTYIYSRTAEIPESFSGKRLLLQFGAVDQRAAVYVNGSFAGEHLGGYLPFSFDITPYIQRGSNHIRVETTDRLDEDLPYGKQREKNGGMWYTPISGIWQPVWLTAVPDNHIRALRLTPTLDSITIETEGGREEKNVMIQTEDGPLSVVYRGNRVTIPLQDPVQWTPEHPYLYEFSLTDGEDRVASYFALRTITVERVNGEARLCLNGKPRFFHGVLDQGYFSDGIYLPGSPEGYRQDMLSMKQLGFDTLRKHIKIEPEAFYYACDKYGMIVFQDMVNSGKYDFLTDTALPTIGWKRRADHRASSVRRAVFEESLRETTTLLYNHPSVCYYTIFNEGWGQYEADRLYREMKALDGTRVWDATSGWFFGKESDVTSEHVYFRKVNLPKNLARPLVLSEFGGYVYKIPEHSQDPKKTYGYRMLKDKQALMTALERLYREEILPAIQNGLDAAILTQLSDVEEEVNGLLTYDRQITKVDADRMRQLAAELRQAFAARSEGK